MSTILKQKQKRKTEKLRQTIVKIAIVIYAIHAYNSCRNRTKLTRQALVNSDQSSWRKLLADGNDNNFLCITGFNRHSFYGLVRHLYPFAKHRSYTGRPSTLSFQDKIGLYLIYCGSTLNGKIAILCFWNRWLHRWLF